MSYIYCIVCIYLPYTDIPTDLIKLNLQFNLYARRLERRKLSPMPIYLFEPANTILKFRKFHNIEILNRCHRLCIPDVSDALDSNVLLHHGYCRAAARRLHRVKSPPMWRDFVASFIRDACDVI